MIKTIKDNQAIKSLNTRANSPDFNGKNQQVTSSISYDPLQKTVTNN